MRKEEEEAAKNNNSHSVNKNQTASKLQLCVPFDVSFQLKNFKISIERNKKFERKLETNINKLLSHLICDTLIKVNCVFF